MDIREKFYEEHLTGFFDQFRFARLLKKIRRQKITSLWEAHLDKMFYEQEMPDDLAYDETKDRQILLEENKKPIGEQDRSKMMAAEERIVHSKSVKASYRKNEAFIAELIQYINMLDMWSEPMKDEDDDEQINSMDDEIDERKE